MAEHRLFQTGEEWSGVNGFDRYYGHCGSLDMPPYVWVDTGKVTALPDRQAWTATRTRTLVRKGQ